MTIKLNFKNARQLRRFSKREFMDVRAWLVFFILAIIFSTLYFLNKYDQTGMSQPEIFAVIIKSSICYTIFMIFPVYVNLNFLKKRFLDKRVFGLWTYLPYILGVLLNAWGFAWIFKIVGGIFPNFLQDDLAWWLNGLIIFSVQLIASGLMYKREWLDSKRNESRKNRIWYRLKWMEEYFTKQINKIEKVNTSSDLENMFIGNTSKTKLRIFPKNEVLFIEPHANGTLIYFTENGGINRVSNSDTLVKCLENEHFAPANLVQIHKSFVINANRVVGRNGNKIMMDVMVKTKTMNSKLGDLDINSNLEVPIGDNYREGIDLNPNKNKANQISKGSNCLNLGRNWRFLQLNDSP